ncbi:MAG: glycosyl hydrolase [Pedosphaera sp. Tous-C6FEB]|nr:MAG: glycosyl hydrolase [Pedosphaera sp. Tous-C6FEB]
MTSRFLPSLPTNPNMSIPRLAPLALAFLLAATSAEAAAKRLLVITQSKGFQHGPVKRAAPDQLCLVEQQMKELGAKSGVFTTDFSQDAIAVLTKENLAKYDALFFYTTGSLLPAGEPREALLDFVKQGKGFIGTHSATDTFKDFKGYTSFINGSFAGHPWGSGGTYGFVSHEPSHPVVAMLGNEFQWKDEIYQYTDYDQKSVRVLYSLDMVKSSPKRPYLVPVCWVREYGTGRLFYTNLGHNDATWKDAKFHEHLLAGIKWATKLIDGPATPNPEVQQAEHNRAVVAFAAALAGKDATAYLAKAKANAGWLTTVTAAANTASKAQDAVGAVRDPDAKKTKPEELDAQKAAAKTKRAELQAKFDEAKKQLVVALEK